MPSRKQTIATILGSFQIIRRALLQQVAERPACEQGESNVSLAEQMTLLTVAARGAVSVKDIASARMISSSAATQVVNSLVKKGYLIRSQDEADRRATVVTLGAAYQKLVASRTDNAASYLTPVFAALTQKELEEYDRLNRKLVDSLRDNASPE
ncbi:hypothetical protein PHACT_07395 [Pseudohongiella acticola]|jgi:DNA-binding MarR family transcriptional regulator|uniref:HTH marR-type domain-containing protein n=1 Tax=Pseudohongiella acticola TaxID=1524254 RepID=A0A1E8CL05_9GAMM|nr:MarR family transcriptional regulator [Pseudohongiella acticola]OFE12982.1 hypothetical protein PHACT_07395 [Pseudohongiella acticola]